MFSTIQVIIEFIVKGILRLGYPGIVVLMALESSFFPFPSEVIMIPAGYLAALGKMNLTVAITLGIAGSLIGALFNYYLSYRYGLPFLRKYGKYFLLPEKKLEEMEKLFYTHGSIITFTGRLVPGVRQYISLPAGVAKMPLWKFIIFTSLGAGMWVTVLALLGYFFGENQALIKIHLHEITYILIVFSLILAIIYVVIYKNKK